MKIEPIATYMESPYIDEDIKAFFKERTYLSHEVPMMQLIKELKKAETTSSEVDGMSSAEKQVKEIIKALDENSEALRALKEEVLASKKETHQGQEDPEKRRNRLAMEEHKKRRNETHQEPKEDPLEILRYVFDGEVQREGNSYVFDVGGGKKVRFPIKIKHQSHPQDTNSRVRRRG